MNYLLDTATTSPDSEQQFLSFLDDCMKSSPELMQPADRAQIERLSVLLAEVML
jgi:hypothetical protein